MSKKKIFFFVFSSYRKKKCSETGTINIIYSPTDDQKNEYLIKVKKICKSFNTVATEYIQE